MRACPVLHSGHCNIIFARPPTLNARRSPFGAHFRTPNRPRITLQDSGEACAAWSAASDDECTWNAEDEFCQGNDGDMDTGSGSGSMDETDGSDHCAAFNDSRNECERSGCDFEAAATTTMPPTNTPTNPPTSPPVSPPTNSDGTCSRNCGTEARGGGTCRLNGRCTSCNENRVIQGGRCYASIACKGRRIQSGSQTGSNCRCVDDNCHYCNRAPEGDVCTG